MDVRCCMYLWWRRDLSRETSMVIYEAWHSRAFHNGVHIQCRHHYTYYWVEEEAATSPKLAPDCRNSLCTPKLYIGKQEAVFNKTSSCHFIPPFNMAWDIGMGNRKNGPSWRTIQLQVNTSKGKANSPVYGVAQDNKGQNFRRAKGSV